MSNRVKLSHLGEFGWLKRLLPQLFWPSSLNPQLCIGPGDDAGVLRMSPGRVLVATTDAMVEGIHFERKWFSWEKLGEKILAVNLSDLAAMGAVKPLAALVTAAFPGDTPVDTVDKFYKGLERCAQRWKTGLLGGDTVGSKRDWFVSVTVLGEANPKELIRRNGARPGDLLVITGPVGLASAGLEVLQSGISVQRWMAPMVRAFSNPHPRLKEGRRLGRHRLASSLMDCSDGLKASVTLLAQASGVGAELHLDALPILAELQRWSKGRKPVWDYALNGGEDYELVMTVKPVHWSRVKRLIPQAVCVGRIVPKHAGLWAVSSRDRFPLKGYGFSHFA